MFNHDHPKSGHGLRRRNSKSGYELLCNLYSLTNGPADIVKMVRALTNGMRNMPSMPGILPDYAAQIIRETTKGRTLTMAR